MSEDCLFLDVWTPAWALHRAIACKESQTNDCPVMLFIHGGGLRGGSKDFPGQEGRAYAERGVVFVRCNYRLGALGWLCPEGGDANNGLWDVVAALRWVHREIKAFGGDPRNITLLGHAAGADVALWLSCAPAVNRLFRRVILQSPSAQALTLAQVQELTQEFSTLAGAASAKQEDMQQLSVEAILQAQRARFQQHPFTPGWRMTMMKDPGEGVEPLPNASPAGLFRFPAGAEPVGMPYIGAVVDGELLKERPLNALAHGVAEHLSFIIGTNREEAFWKPEDESLGCRVEELEALIRRFTWEIAGVPALVRAQPEELVRTVRALVAYYEQEFQASEQVAPSKVQWLQDRMTSDFRFTVPELLVSERLARPGAVGCLQVYRYQFNGVRGRGDGLHGAELPLMLGEGDVGSEWLDAWASFSHMGDPNKDPDAEVQWQPHTCIGRPILIVDGARRACCSTAMRIGLQATARLWEELLELERVALLDRLDSLWSLSSGQLLSTSFEAVVAATSGVGGMLKFW